MLQKFLIEVPHDGDKGACARAVDAFLRTGSHFLTHAHWGCRDGVHKAWIIVEVDTRDEARNIVPADLRPTAQVVQLNAFTMQDLDKFRHHLTL